MRLLSLFSSLLSSFWCIAQCTPCNDPAPVGIIDFNSARISVIAGGNLEFNFLSIQDYVTGITLTDKTILGISVCDCASEFGADPVVGSTLSGWDLYFDTDDANFQGQNGANTIPLCVVEAVAAPQLGMAGVTFNPRQPLKPPGLPATPLASEVIVSPNRF